MALAGALVGSGVGSDGAAWGRLEKAVAENESIYVASDGTEAVIQVVWESASGRPSAVKVVIPVSDGPEITLDLVADFGTALGARMHAEEMVEEYLATH